MRTLDKGVLGYWDMAYKSGCVNQLRIEDKNGLQQGVNVQIKMKI